MGALWWVVWAVAWAAGAVAACLLAVYGATVVVIRVGEWRVRAAAAPCALYVLRALGCCQYLGISVDPEGRRRQHKAKARQHGRGRWKTAVDGQTLIRWCASEGQARRVERRMILAFRWTTIVGRCFLFLPRRWVGNAVYNRQTRGSEALAVPVWAAWYSWRSWVARTLADGPDVLSGLEVDGGFVRPWEPLVEAPSEAELEGDALLFKTLGIERVETSR